MFIKFIKAKTDNLYINHGEQMNEVYLRFFRNIFAKSDQIGHYNMMTGNENVVLDRMPTEI